MEDRLKNVLIWAAVLMFCFVGIPIHLRGSGVGSEEEAFLSYTRSFNKSYGSAAEREVKRAAFQKSLEQIHVLNARSGEQAVLSSDGGDFQPATGRHVWSPGMEKTEGVAKWGLTPFADLSPAEFERSYLDPGLHERVQKRRKSKAHFHHGHRDHSELAEGGLPFQNLVTRKRRSVVPSKVDWRGKGIVTKVKHQKACGACWAFSTVETVESMHALQKGQLQDLSVQQVIDCAKNGNMGCNGGDTCTAIDWMTLEGLSTEQAYPLTLKNQACFLQSSASRAVGVKVNSNYSCAALDGSEDRMLEVIANHGPITVAVDATNWQFYVGGVIQWNCDTNLNHAVQIVGYDKTAVPPHYIVRNSWGTGFGDNGYLYVATGSNLCGIASHVAWLSVA